MTRIILLEGKEVGPVHKRFGHCDAERRMASGTWFGETSRQSQAELVKQQHTGISPNHVPEAVRHSKFKIIQPS